MQKAFEEKSSSVPELRSGSGVSHDTGRCYVGERQRLPGQLKANPTVRSGCAAEVRGGSISAGCARRRSRPKAFKSVRPAKNRLDIAAAGDFLACARAGSDCQITPGRRRRGRSPFDFHSYPPALPAKGRDCCKIALPKIMCKKPAAKEVFWLLLRPVLVVGCCFFVQVAIAFSFRNSPCLACYRSTVSFTHGSPVSSSLLASGCWVPT